MKTMVTIATCAFWLAVAAVHGLAANDSVRSVTAASPAEPRYRLADLGRHAGAASCWMAIDGVVYDFTDYLPRHPADPKAMLRHCGGDASEAFRTKDAGRPHSPHAQGLLRNYRIGVLAR